MGRAKSVPPERTLPSSGAAHAALLDGVERSDTARGTLHAAGHQTLLAIEGHSSVAITRPHRGDVLGNARQPGRHLATGAEEVMVVARRVGRFRHAIDQGLTADIR
jgi:hypothetical protein